MISISFCDYGYGYCTAPDTICPHWQGTFCELDLLTEGLKKWEEENSEKKNCHKCVYEVECADNPVGCKRYKRDAPDGGYCG